MSLKKILGWISLLVWCAIGLIIMWLPFSDFTPAQKALGMTVLFGVNKIFLVLIIFLLGEKYVQGIKNWFLNWWRKK